jgi:hydroxymethylglutaryl-CoA lyase
MEDLCFMLDSMGLRTGVDIEQLIAIRQIIREALPDIEMHGALSRAGLPTHYRTMQDPAREAVVA